MLKLRKIAVTGSLSCGKSSVCHLLKECGAYIVSADEIVHQLLSIDTNLIQKVINLLGSEIVLKGQLDRAKIAKKVFTDPRLLQELESILHPAVNKEIEKRFVDVKEDPQVALFVAEIPLLFELGQETLYDATVAVVADPEICRQRFVDSTGYSEEEYEKRVARLLPISKKIQKADFVIKNNGNQEELRQAVKGLYTKLS